MTLHLCKLRNVTNFQEDDVKFHCGACSKHFQSICHLHCHIKVHNIEGSYIFDNVFKIAFPKNESACSYSQTDSLRNNFESDENISTGSVNIVPVCDGLWSGDLSDKIVKGKYKICTEKKQQIPRKKQRNGVSAVTLVTEVPELVPSLTCKVTGPSETGKVTSPSMTSKRVTQAKANIKDKGSIFNCYVKLKKIDQEYGNRKLTDLQNIAKYGQYDSSSSMVIQRGHKNEVPPSYSVQKQDIADFSPETHIFDEINNEADNDLDAQNYCISSAGVENIVEVKTISERDYDNIRDSYTELNGTEINKTNKSLVSSNPSESFLNLNLTLDAIKTEKDVNTLDVNVNNIKQETAADLLQVSKVKKTNIVARSQKTNRVKKSKQNRSKTAKTKDTTKQETNAIDSLTDKKHELIRKKYKKKEIKGTTICDICGLEFSRRQYKYHQVKHTGERPHLCNHCGRSFTLRKYLQKHLVQHQAVKPHTCSFCGSGFGEKNQLQQHINIHTGNKPYSCEKCEKAFCHMSNLKFHIKSVHLDERKYECQTCKHKFKKNSHLETHMLCHSKASFECIICHKKFKTPKSLKRHMKIHNSQVFKCTNCSRKFPVLDYLFMHMQRCHKINKLEAVDLWKSGAIESYPVEKGNDQLHRKKESDPPAKEGF